MPQLPEFLGLGHAMLLAGAVMLYIASRAGVHTLAGSGANPGRRALGHWIPIAATALAALALHRGDLAISIIFATSVGCLSLFLGSICIVSPNADAPQSVRRLWALAMPAAMLTLLVGFAGHFTWHHAVMLLFEGLALLIAWQELSGADEIVAAVGETELPATIEHSFPHRWRVDLTLVVVLSFVGAIGGVLGAERVGQNSYMISDMATFIAILGPLLVLPMLTGSAKLAQRNLAWVATTSGVGIVLLNLCLLLPAVILLQPFASPHLETGGWSWAHFNLAGLAVLPMPFSWVTWRVDNVVLVVLAFMLVPASMGRWRMGKAEGFTLIALYGVYVLMEAAASMRN